MRTKLFIATFIGLIFTINSFSQSPSRIHSISVYDPNTDRAGSPRNVWATSAQIYYSILGEGEFIDNFGASAKALLEVLGKETPSYGLYVMGNLSRLTTSTDNEDIKPKLIELQKSSQGINVGLYPHFVIGDPNDKSMIFYGSVAYKVNALEDDQNSIFYFNQLRLTLGIEVSGLKGFKSKLPVTLSFEPTYTFFKKDLYMSVFGEDKSNVFGINAVFILPVGNSIGLMGDYLYSKDTEHSLSLGLLLTN